MFDVFVASDPGLRDSREDAYVTHERCVVVCDGMGGHGGGARAADIAAHAIAEELRESDDIESAIGFACREIEARGAGGTTAVVVLFTSSRQVRIAWVGDSRAYHVQQGEAFRITDDHVGPDGGLSRWLPDEPGSESLDVVVEPGDCLVVCTDGVSNELDEDAIALIVDADDPAELLVEAALDAGASDNCTAVVCRVK